MLVHQDTNPKTTFNPYEIIRIELDDLNHLIKYILNIDNIHQPTAEEIKVFQLNLEKLVKYLEDSYNL